MKKSLLLFSAVILLATFALTGCLKDKCSRTIAYIKVEPVYKTFDEIHR